MNKTNIQKSNQCKQKTNVKNQCLSVCVCARAYMWKKERKKKPSTRQNSATHPPPVMNPAHAAGPFARPLCNGRLALSRAHLRQKKKQKKNNHNYY